MARAAVAAISARLTTSASARAWLKAIATACGPVPRTLRAENKTVPTRAMPKAPPRRCAVLSTPLAAPLSAGGTAASVRLVLGATMSPWPSPVSSSGPTRYHPDGTVAAWTTSSSEPSPAMTRPQPMARVCRPKRRATVWLERAVSIAPTANGLTTRPLASALCAKPSCQVMARLKKMLVKLAKYKAANSAPIAKDGRRTTRGGISGVRPLASACRSQRQRAAASGTAAAKDA
jgi:hypothetical protein